MVICLMTYLRFALFVVAASTIPVATARSQARQTATKSADIAVFGGWVGAHPDYGPYNSYGGMFGADYTRYFHSPVVPSLEFRANFHSNIVVKEHSYVVGLRAVAPFRLIRPYADFLVGPGTIDFPYNIGYTHDDSVVYSYGGGVDVPVFRNFEFRADLQGQHWNLQPLTYTPSLLTLGVRYTIPFRAYVSQRDLGR